MKILILSPFPPPADGIANHTLDIATELEKRGHDVHILSPGRGPNSPNVTRGLHIATRRADRDLIDWSDAVLCQFAISALRIGTFGADALLKRARSSGKPVIVAVHEPTREPNLLGPLSRTIYRRTLAQASVALAFSQAGEHALRHSSLTPNSTPVVRSVHGVAPIEPPTAEEIARVGLKYGVNRRTALQVGFIHPDKGIESLIAANNPSFSITVAGTIRERRGLFRLMGMNDKRYAQQLRELDSRSNANVNWCGFVPNDEIHALIAAAGVIVLPYAKAAQSGIVSLLQAVGAPAIASSLLATQLGGGAIIVDPVDSKAFSQSILSVLEDDEKRTSLASRAKDLGERHTYAQLVQDLEILMTEVPQENPSAED